MVNDLFYTNSCLSIVIVQQLEFIPHGFHVLLSLADRRGRGGVSPTSGEEEGREEQEGKEVPQCHEAS